MGKGNKIWKLKTEEMDFGSYSFEIIKKKIKHIYFRIDPSKKKIMVSAPDRIDPETLNKAIESKKDWIFKQVKKNKVVRPDPVKAYVTGEQLLFKGESYDLHVLYQKTHPMVFITEKHRIQLIVPCGNDVYDREKMILGWYRKELKQSIKINIARWEPLIGVKVNDFGVRKMKTRWGSCNTTAGRIWLNLALIKLADPFLEYVIVHEMVHLLERRHNTRFKAFMDQFIPDWRNLKKELNRFAL
ncbi:MAG: M48 family metallopeptidase [Proteobacteria bacterium]|nr:M48 family metallopeptidase [Pseudomonadota bacterium]MBU1583939.1 M48 family metallopeptidase [Pseudomonadota bacterium]MBU2453559.1 M48 family metallopeptidase [Pseudomonadota bacterium]MBU2630922.1 M48 family metallopeptidase [Pseudomonadota bacterium]